MSPLPSDFQQIADHPPGEEPGYGQELQNALAGMREFQAKLSVQAKQNEQVLPPQSIQTNVAKGTVTLKDLPIATYEAYNRDRQELNQIRGAFHQEAERLQAQEQNIRNQPPWVQLATALSANLANQKDMPGWVRGLGQTAAQLNPQADQIRNQRLAVLGEEANLAQKSAALDESALRTNVASQDMALRREELNRKSTEDQARDVRDARDKLLAAAQKGEAPPPEVVAQVFQGLPPEKAAAITNAITKTNEAAQARIAKELDAKAAKDAAVEDRFNRSLKAMAERQDKALAAAEKARAEAVARGEMKDAAKAAKAAEPSPVLKKQLADLNAADTALDKIEAELMKPENQAVMGPFAGRLASGAAKVGADPGGRIAELKQRLGLQTAQAIKATGAGARGFGPQERPYFEQLAEGINRTPQQNLRIVQGWRDFLDQERRGIQIANPDVVSNPKYAGVWGKRLSPQPEETGPKKGKTKSGVEYEIVGP